MPIASITKLITSLVVLDYTNIERFISVPSDALVFTSVPRLRVGQKISILDLLSLLLIESSNEAGITLATYLGPEKTIERMNYQAKSIGMENTNFVDPNGSSLENVSTPLDLYQLAKYLYFNRSFVLNITKGIFDNDSYKEPAFNFKNSNLFYDDKNFVGGKMGITTGSRETMLAIFNIPFDEEIRPVAFIALRSKDIYADIIKMVEFVKNYYQFANE
jgi:D-alanyl-D-alanine carboxypeptidase